MTDPIIPGAKKTAVQLAEEHREYCKIPLGVRHEMAGDEDHPNRAHAPLPRCPGDPKSKREPWQK